MRAHLVLLLVIVLLGGCASPPPRVLSTELPADAALLNGHDPLNPEVSLIERDIAFGTGGGIPYFEQLHERPLQVLQLSGGGQNGAFGAGVLYGWAETGRRPQFDMVTGISTGALQATFAFLGTPEDDEALRALFTETAAADIYTRKNKLSLLGRGNSLYDTGPLARLIEKYVTAEVIARVAAEHAKGRRLGIGATNLDYNMLWIFSLGEIAARGTPEAVDLYRRLLLAAASPPIAFPPVEIGGHLFVDGAVTDNLLVVGQFQPPNPDERFGGPPGSIYVIHNGRLEETAGAAKPTVAGIVERTLNIALDNQMGGNLIRAYALARLHDYGFRLVQIPLSVDMGNNPLAFDPRIMRRLFDAGHDLGRRPEDWATEPPPTQQIPPWLIETLGHMDRVNREAP